METKKMKIEQKEEKVVSTEWIILMKQKKSLILDEKVHLNKSLANLNYFRKIIENNQESIIFPFYFF